MKKLIAVLAACLLLPSVVSASQTIAVVGAGHSDPNINRVLGIDITRALVQTGLFRESPRYEEFMAALNVERQRQTTSESRIVDIAKAYGMDAVCFVNIISAFETNHISAKIVNAANNTTITNAEVYNALATMADLRNAAAELANAMSGRIRQQAQPQQHVQAQQQPVQAQQQFAQPQQQIMPQQQFAQAQQINPMRGDGQGQQIITLQPGQHIIQGPAVQTIIINVTAPQQQQRMPQRRERSEERSDFWKQRWIYLGGSFGTGAYDSYYDSWDCYYYGEYCGDDGTSIAFQFVADFPLLAPVLSLEAGAVLGYPMLGAYAMARAGFISEYFESTFDLGFIIGSMSLTIGNTTGFKVGRGMLFFRYQYAENLIWRDSLYSHTASIGYKVGVGRVRQ